MAFLSIEDILDTIEVIVFPETYARCAEVLSSTDPVIIQGVVQQDERGPKIIADSIDLLPEAREKYTESAKIRMESTKLSRHQLEKVKKVLYQFHGSCPVLLTLYFPGKGEVDVEVIRDLTIRPCKQVTDNVEKILNYKAISFMKKPIIPAPRKKRWDREKSGLN